MNVVPKGATPSQPTDSQPTAQSGRERAIARLTERPSAPIPVNPNNISVEDLGAIRSPQKDTSSDEQQVVAEASPPQPVTEETPLSSQYAVLARKEKALRAKAQAQEAAWKQRELEFQQREEAIKAKDAEYQSKYIPKDRLTNDTLNALTDAGLTYEQITQLMLNQPDPQSQAQADYQRRIDAKLVQIEEAQKRAEQSVQQQQKQQYDQALNQISLEAKDLVASDPDTYEAINSTGSIRDVVKLIERTFNEDGVLMTVEDAAREVEEYLTEEATKLSRLKKIQRIINANANKQSQQPQATPATKSSQPQTMKTLTNSVGASGKLSQRDRAILAFKGELGK